MREIQAIYAMTHLINASHDFHVIRRNASSCRNYAKKRHEIDQYHNDQDIIDTQLFASPSIIPRTKSIFPVT